MNLYGFCGNDPIDRFDLNGNSWFSKFWDRTVLSFSQHVRQNWDDGGRTYAEIAAVVIASIFVGEEVDGLVFTPGVTAADAASEAGVMSGATQMSGALAGAVTSGTISSTTAGVIAGMAGGAAGGFIGGSSMAAIAGENGSGVIQSGLNGAAGGALLGGVGGYFGSGPSSWTNPIERIGATSVAGGLASEIEGGNFERGALLAGGFSTAAYGYNEMVSYAANPEPGGDAAMKTGTTGAVENANNVGLESGNPLDERTGFVEGSPFSNSLNEIPGLNAIASLHDSWWHFFPDNSLTFRVFNVPSMLPAAAISWAAILGQDPAFGSALYAPRYGQGRGGESTNGMQTSVPYSFGAINGNPWWQ